MLRMIDDPEQRDGRKSDPQPADGLHTLDEARGYLRDAIALSTLPVIWMGAHPDRIAESLLAVIDSTLRPALSYIRIISPLSQNGMAIERACAHGEPLAPERIERYGAAIRQWVLTHDPDEVLTIEDQQQQCLRICAYPLGPECEMGVLAVGFAESSAASPAPTRLQRMLVNVAANQAITSCKNLALQYQSESARDETQALYDVSRTLAAELDLQTIMQKATDAATRCTRAKFGAFFHNVINDSGEAYMLYSLSGAPREAFEKFGMPRNTALFDHTFRGQGPMRLDDVTRDPRYGRMGPHYGMPRGHLPVRSYLAVPVTARNGEVFGGLFFGHPEPGVFDARAERIAEGVAWHAAVALENARLFAKAEAELEQRKREEEARRQGEERLRLAAEAAGFGTFELDLRTGENIWSDRLKAIFGLGPDAPTPVDPVTAGFIHPDDAQRVASKMQTCFDPAGDGLFHDEHRIVRADGAVRWVVVTGRTFFEHTPQGRSALRALGAVMDITDRKLAEEALQEAGRRKDEFIATLAHELRNPLAPIRMAVNILRASPDDPQRIHDITCILDRQCSQLVRLIDDLLDVSRVTRGKIALKKQRVELASILLQAVESVKPLCENRNHQLTLDLPPQPIMVDADPVRLVQIVGNLLNNSCKYTDPGGTIRLVLERGDNEAVIRVIDSGMGIEPDQLTRIFDMFAQVERSSTRAPGGLGIGLSLSKSLVELHGGQIEARSAGIDRGSEFIVRLPIVKFELTAGRSMSREHDAERRATEGKYDAERSATSDVQTRKPLASRRILAVDDNVDALRSVSMLLRLNGHLVYTAESGEEALRILEEQHPEVVLLDIGLPGINGYELARRIRSGSRCQDVLLVAMTGWGQEHDKRRAAEAGFDAHLTKPANPEALMNLIEGHFCG